MSKEEYKLAVGMYQQYIKDVAMVGNAMNIYQLKTLQLLEKNFRENRPIISHIFPDDDLKYITIEEGLVNKIIKPKWYQKLMGAFKNRKL